MTEAKSLFGGDSGDEYARTDLVSNHTVFKDQEYYRALLQGQDLPVHTFSSFIHEATHHWCFISPVGTALSLLYLSAARKALRWLNTNDYSQFQEALDDLCAFEVAVNWLRPLNEGLAQFAEYDVLPPESGRLISPPLNATLRHLFNLPHRLAASRHANYRRVFYELADDIRRWRLSRQTVERKSELLLQPIGAQGSAYLLGYLTIKQLWKNAGRFYRELKDADVFLMFLRKLVFGDYVLVAEILDRKRPPHHRGLRIGECLHNRLQAIRLMLFNEDVPWPVIERILTPSSAKDDAPSWIMPDDRPFAGLDTKELASNGISLLFEYFREVSEPLDLGSGQLPASFRTRYFHDVMRERHLMWLGDVAAKWISTGRQAGRITVDGDVIFDNFKLAHASDEGLNDLTLDIYVDLYNEYQLTTVGNERGVFGFASNKEVSDRTQSELMKTLLDRRGIAQMTELIHMAIRAYVNGTNYQQSLEQFWTNGARDLLDETYLGFAFDFDDNVQSVVAGRGMADVLQNDGELVRNVAAISLAASAEMSPEELLSMCSDYPLNPFDAVKRVSKLWRFVHFPLASIKNDGFLSSTF